MNANLARKKRVIFELARPKNWLGGLVNWKQTALFRNGRGGDPLRAGWGAGATVAALIAVTQLHYVVCGFPKNAICYH